MTTNGREEKKKEVVCLTAVGKISQIASSPISKRAMTSFTNWSLADVHVNAKGAKTCQLAVDGRPLHRSSDGFCTAPFGGPSNFDKDVLATRQNLELRIPAVLEAYLAEVDAWMLGYLLAHSERIFKKQLSVEQVRDAESRERFGCKGGRGRRAEE